MRDQRFVAVHRGGPLTLEHHRLLIHWAQKCVLHVLPLLEDTVDKRLTFALEAAEGLGAGQCFGWCSYAGGVSVSCGGSRRGDAPSDACDSSGRADGGHGTHGGSLARRGVVRAQGGQRCGQISRG